VPPDARGIASSTQIQTEATIKSDSSKLLKKIRLKLKFTQYQFAPMLGISRDCYANYETGRNRTPGDVILKAQAIEREKA
jgi:predicted transcriptional regulator